MTIIFIFWRFFSTCLTVIWPLFDRSSVTFGHFFVFDRYFADLSVNNGHFWSLTHPKPTQFNFRTKTIPFSRLQKMTTVGHDKVPTTTLDDDMRTPSVSLPKTPPCSSDFESGGKYDHLLFGYSSSDYDDDTPTVSCLQYGDQFGKHSQSLLDKEYDFQTGVIIILLNCCSLEMREGLTFVSVCTLTCSTWPMAATT